MTLTLSCIASGRSFCFFPPRMFSCFFALLFDCFLLCHPLYLASPLFLPYDPLDPFPFTVSRFLPHVILLLAPCFCLPPCYMRFHPPPLVPMSSCDPPCTVCPGCARSSAFPPPSFSPLSLSPPLQHLALGYVSIWILLPRFPVSHALKDHRGLITERNR